MKQDVMLINTARGAILDTNAVIEALQGGKIGALGIDVYEWERGVFFYDHSSHDLNDPVLERLLAMPNVLVTPHQGFATKEALTNIAEATVKNINCWKRGQRSPNEL